MDASINGIVVEFESNSWCVMLNHGKHVAMFGLPILMRCSLVSPTVTSFSTISPEEWFQIFESERHADANTLSVKKKSAESD